MVQIVEHAIRQSDEMPISRHGLSLPVTTIQLILAHKELEICFFPLERLIQTYIVNIGPRSDLKGVTTSLYKRAFGLMEDFTAMIGGPVEYSFFTCYPSMRLWALDPNRGQGIFHWNEVTDSLGHFTAIKTFRTH